MNFNLHVIADTNIYLNNLELLKRLVDDEYPFVQILCVLNIILEELDYRKSMKKTRDAIRFINSHLKSPHLAVVDIPVPALYKLKNDDKIIEITKNIENSILVTQDVVMSIKAYERGINFILVKDKCYKELKKSIITKAGLGCVEVYQENDIGKDYLLDRARNLLFYPILYRMHSMVGGSVVYFTPQRVEDASFADLIKVVIKHFDMFKDVLPNYTDNILSKMLKEIDKDDIHRLKYKLGVVLAMFGIIDDYFT